MDRFDVVRFEDLNGPDGGSWKRIGGGSFGVVFQGEYLGTKVAIKEVLPNNTYDVEKYFERECVLMKEARHPNIVQYIGLTRSNTANDGRIYIISEFVGGNLRSFLADTSKPFDWPLRISFATDIARAVAYLHARNCMHRDLKGENLLITDNQRIKVCDFGFARIAARNDEEMKRISYCGTDGYMSPEILMGIDFSLPSDVFSLGIIFCEIASRHLVDANTFKRLIPSFGLDPEEIHEMASPGCPADLIQLCIDMTEVEASMRPDMRTVLRRLRAIEQEVIHREMGKGTLNNIGSLRGASLAAVLGQTARKGRTSSASRRLPSFDGHVSYSQIRRVDVDPIKEATHERAASDTSDEEVERALKQLETFVDSHSGQSNFSVADTIRAASTFKVAGHGDPWWIEEDEASISPLPASWLQQARNAEKQTTKADDLQVQQPTKPQSRAACAGITPSEQDTITPLDSIVLAHRRLPLSTLSNQHRTPSMQESLEGTQQKATTQKLSSLAKHGHHGGAALAVEDTTSSFMTARSIRKDEANGSHPLHAAKDTSFAMATLASTFYDPDLIYHRFTLVKNGARRASEETSPLSGSRLPYQLILANALTRCQVCSKRLGFGAYMDCDDCPCKTHVGCGALAEPDCRPGHLADGSGHSSPRSALLQTIEEGHGSVPTSPTHSIGRTVPASSSPNHRWSMGATTTPVKKTPPNSFSKGVALFRKRHSKSPGSPIKSSHAL